MPGYREDFGGRSGGLLVVPVVLVVRACLVDIFVNSEKHSNNVRQIFAYILLFVNSGGRAL